MSLDIASVGLELQELDVCNLSLVLRCIIRYMYYILHNGHIPI